MSWFGAWWPWGTSHRTAAPTDDQRRYAGSRSRDVDEDTGLGRGGKNTITLEAMDIRRNTGTGASLGKLFTANVVGRHGIMPQAQTSDPVWNEKAEKFFREWCKIADFRRRDNFAGIQKQAVNARLWAGDIFYLFTESGQLQPIESSRVRTPTKFTQDKQVVDGVRLTKEGIAVSFYVCERNDGLPDPDTFQEVAAENIAWLRAPSFRSDCLRPVGEAQDAIVAIRDLEELRAAILNKAKMEARDVAVVSTAEGPGKIDVIAQLEINPENTSETIGQVYEKIGGAKTYYTRVGETVTHPALSAPGQNYVPYLNSLYADIGASMRIPGEYLRMAFEASFSASNAAVMQVNETFGDWESWLIDGILQRVWNWRIAKAIKAGDLPPAPVDEAGISEWYKVAWIGPKRPGLDPLKQANTNLAQFKMGTDSIQSMTQATTGRDWESDVLIEKEKAIIAAMESAKRIRDKTGIMIGWEKMIEVTNSVSADATPQPEPMPKDAPNA